MKIEKINDDQIRCILSKQDLVERGLRLSEFVYGSSKAKQLFQDMIQAASEQYNFVYEDQPLMVEAIPTTTESLILIISKVNDADELDPRFSNFTGFENPADLLGEDNADSRDASDTSNEPFRRRGDDEYDDTLPFTLPKASDERDTVSSVRTEHGKDSEFTMNRTEAFDFYNLKDLSAFAAAVDSSEVKSSLYYDEAERIYTLCLSPRVHNPKIFTDICNLACEFASHQPKATVSYYSEHYRLILRSNALKQLRELS